MAAGVAGCKQDVPADIALQQPRGATVAFDSIDGLPRPQFQTLVNNLNDEAQSRRLAVISREGSSAYRVRGYLAATVSQGRTTVSWIWDVFDSEQNRVLRIAGEETAKQSTGAVNEAWNVADEAMLRRIARSSMDQLSTFLTSPEVAPASLAASAQTMALDDTSPEAAGIFRIYHASADPLPAAAADATSAAGAPLPPRRPQAPEARVEHAPQAPALSALALADPAL